ncbi:MAG: MarR family transcriptional regulator [Labilithrix sp.]|nr:MarR family transcriptional regulator [Labilithrix sp.]
MSPPEKGSRPRGDKPGPAREPSALGVALDFLRLLWAVDHGLQRRSKRMESELGVTGMQRIIIRLIGRYPEVAAGRLAELVHVHPSTLTGVLRRLVDRGFVQRERDPEDARRTKFSLLPSGEAIDATQAGTVEAAVRRALARMPPESIDAARSVLAVLAEELGRSDR